MPFEVPGLPPLYTVNEAAEILNMRVAAINYHCREGHLPHTKRLGRRLVDIEKLRTLLKSDLGKAA